MANRTIRTAEKDDRFLLEIAAGKPVGDACRAVKYGRRTVYEWRDSDAAFAARWADAVADAIERFEAEADRRALAGTLRPVFYQGGECGSIREFSDTLLIFRLKALAPDRYRERASIEHTGKDGTDLIPPEADPQRLAHAVLAMIEGARAARAAAAHGAETTETDPE